MASGLEDCVPRPSRLAGLSTAAAAARPVAQPDPAAVAGISAGSLQAEPGYP
jgi:hypothetical protein